MKTGANPYNKLNAQNTYMVKEIMEAPPEKLLIKVYDFAIQHCRLHDLEKTNRAIGVLISSLSFEDEKAKDVAIGLLKLYQFAQDQMRKKNYDVVYTILTDLRQAWLTSFNEAQKSLKKEQNNG